jgi:hypothetical protein
MSATKIKGLCPAFTQQILLLANAIRCNRLLSCQSIKFRTASKIILRPRRVTVIFPDLPYFLANLARIHEKIFRDL